MKQTPVQRLADAYGLQYRYQTESGTPHTVSDENILSVLQVMDVAVDDPKQIKARLEAAPAPPDRKIAAPEDARCFVPDWLAGGRAWGVTCQLYGLRSDRNHGIGDFEDLARLAEIMAANGADFIGVNPVHALFSADAQRCSPFAPSNRRFLNPLYIALDCIRDITATIEIDDTERMQCCATPGVDYGEVARLKLRALRDLWRRINNDHALWPPAARADFENFVAGGGESLRAHACFEALSHHMVTHGKGAGWHSWPPEYQSASSPAVSAFAAEQADEVRFHQWLQWVADRQLAEAASRARQSGMRIGLYLDFAVGTAADGSATWSDPALVVANASIGAPPDAFFVRGQDWGLAPMSPVQLRERELLPYRQEIESALRHAGAIRIDHAMGLHRLYWIPHGAAPKNGCYVIYPLQDMLRILAEVSVAAETLVIGEDLGTVPKGFSKMMHRAGMLSYRILYFEQVDGQFPVPRALPKHAFLSVSTHDLPPLASWWSGSDIDLFRELGLLDARVSRERRSDRKHDRAALLARLHAEANRRAFTVKLPGTSTSRSRSRGSAKLSKPIAAAIHSYLARSASMLVGVQLEDLGGADAPVNVPGTHEEYPNWRLRAPLRIEDIDSDAFARAILDGVARERPRNT